MSTLVQGFNQDQNLTRLVMYTTTIACTSWFLASIVAYTLATEQDTRINTSSSLTGTTPSPVLVSSSNTASSTDANTISTLSTTILIAGIVASIAIIIILVYVRRRYTIPDSAKQIPDAPETREYSNEYEFHKPTSYGRRLSDDFPVHAVPSPPSNGQTVDLWDDLENLHSNSLHHSGSSDRSRN